MRFGAAFIPAMPAADVVRTAELAERHGYDVLWIPDQSFYADPFVLLGLCATATSRIGLGIAVTNPFTRHPVQIARAAAALDDASGGRFLLGLGAGNRTHVLPALGAPVDRTVPRLEECIDVCRRLLRGDTVTLSSPTLRLDRVRLGTEPRPGVPIYVAGRAPRVLRLAGARADGVLIEAMFTSEGVDYALGEVEAGARSAGRQLTDLELVAWQALQHDPARARDWAARILAGTPRAVLDRIGIPAAVTPGSVPDDVVERLVFVGGPDMLAARVRALEARGVDMVSVISFGSTEGVQETVRGFAVDVVAQFRGP